MTLSFRNLWIVSLALYGLAGSASAGSISGQVFDLPANGLGLIASETIDIELRDAFNNLVGSGRSGGGLYSVPLTVTGRQEVTVFFSRRGFRTRSVPGIVVDGSRNLVIDATVPIPAGAVVSAPCYVPTRGFCGLFSRRCRN